MKKRFSFLVCLLFSMIAASFAQQTLPVKFSSEDGVESYWYYINFTRRLNTSWTVDHNASGEVQQKARVVGDHSQQWKLVGTQTSFYFVNRATGYLMAYTGTPIKDSNDKPVPLNSNIDVEPPVNGDGAVYYTDKDITVETAAKIRIEWRSQETQWGPVTNWICLNNGLTGATPLMNDRAGRNVCNYGTLDTGAPIAFISADKPVIIVNETNFTRDGLVNYKSIIPVAVSSMITTGNITGTFSGPDASAFSFGEGGNTINKEGKLNVIFFPTEAGKKYEATLILSSPGADDVKINLSGTAFEESALPVTFSSYDDSDEHWYYIQFARKASANLVWAMNDSTRMVGQDTLRAGESRLDNQWKICGDWELGYFIVNRATNAEVMYNTRQNVQSGEEVRIFTDVPSSDRYVLPPAGEVGNDFEFVRYRTTNNWQILNRSIARYNYPNYKYINDSGGRYLCHYTVDDTGNELLFFPSDIIAILAPVTPIKIIAAEGETESAVFKVGGATNTTDNITVSITGDSEGIFSVEPAVLPFTGGDVTITFNNPEGAPMQYKAFLTLKTQGAEDVVVQVTGAPKNAIPKISTDETEYWYNIQYNRKATLVWQGNGESDISQVAPVENKTSQQWKFVSAGESGYFIENREGGQMFFKKNEEGNYADDVRANLAEKGTAIEFIETESGIQMQTLEAFLLKTDSEFINDYQGTKVCFYSKDDGGNYLTFIPTETVTFTSIKKPDVNVDSNDRLIAERYYTLQGVEVKQPGVTGIYIVRKLYASGKTQTTKALIHVR